MILERENKFVRRIQPDRSPKNRALIAKFVIMIEICATRFLGTNWLPVRHIHMQVYV